MTLLVTPAFASRTVTPINSGNPTCDDFAPAGESWTQFKLQDANLADGTYSDGTLEVTIDNYVNSSSGTPGSFDWSANLGVDAVFVKAGSDKHNLYTYDPEATSDTGLGPQAGQGNGISHISFCYDEGEDATPTPTPTQAATATPTQAATATPTQAATPTPESSVKGSTSTPSPSPEQSVQGATGTPAPSQPDTAMALQNGPSATPTVAFALILLAALGTLAWANVRTARSRA